MKRRLVGACQGSCRLTPLISLFRLSLRSQSDLSWQLRYYYNRLPYFMSFIFKHWNI